ncbi:hypothetical protein J1N35_032819 [Gossypium stocksii]|uniref:Uncharacterized protein n=1 Tax=Gossypium stocksii TaxID=47602 RepID=A0A9D3V4C2_9ROSI|nr:hypothetical protein J1N35_032819 [Gossypium stocksii]
MSSRKGGSKGKEVSGVSSPKGDQLSHGVAEMNLDSSQDDGEWEVIQRKPKNRGGSTGAKPWGSQNSNPKPWNRGMRGNAGPGRGTGGNAWANHGADSRMATGRGNSRPQVVNKSLDNHEVLPILSFARLLSMVGIGNQALVPIHPRVSKMDMRKTMSTLRLKKTTMLMILRMVRMMLLLMILTMSF